MGIEPEVQKERFDRHRAGPGLTTALVRKDDLHSLMRYWEGLYA